MKSNILNFFLVILICSLSKQTLATAQIGDLLIVENDTTWITSNPLEAYFEKKGSREIGTTKIVGSCTALWRGYVATWKLRNDSLFLVRVQTNYCGDDPTEIDIVKEFGSKEVFAEWAETTLVRPLGDLLHYVHMAYMSVYEGEIFYTIKAGLLTETKKEEYLIHDNDRAFPGQRFLRDTIMGLILKSIPMDERQDFDEESTFSVDIQFNEKGKIAEIKLGYDDEPKNLMQKTLLAKTKEILANFPKLMKVEHEGYHSPTINIWISGHCLKYPLDREYGCDYE